MLEKPRASSTASVGGHLSGTGRVTPRPESFRTFILRCARPSGRPASSVTEPRTSSDDEEALAVAMMLALPRTFSGAERTAWTADAANNVLNTRPSVRMEVRAPQRLARFGIRV